MKVYAEYFKENGKEYRGKTLLQFGDSTKLIGSAVLMNPGSAKLAKELDKADEKTIRSFYGEHHPKEKIDLKTWSVFYGDQTMGFLIKIFNGGYVGEQKRLNGIIQLFNCFYYRDQNADNALQNLETSLKYDENRFLLDKPVYYGWGNEGKYGKLHSIAEEIFSQCDFKSNPCYDTDFKKNLFYHPGYINRVSKKTEALQSFLKHFYQLVAKQEGVLVSAIDKQS
jgi:hypothetical protein